jgi:ribosomal subunit interface protein
MDVVVKSRHCNLSDQFRSYVDEKITRLEKLDDRVIRVEVEVSAERNKRQHDQASRVEITVRSRGPVTRAEAAAEDKQAGTSRPALTSFAARRRSGIAADREWSVRDQRVLGTPGCRYGSRWRRTDGGT